MLPTLGGWVIKVSRVGVGGSEKKQLLHNLEITFATLETIVWWHPNSVLLML